MKSSTLWLGFLSLSIVLAAASSAHIKMLLSIDDLIDPDFKTYSALTHLNTSFADKNNLFVVISSDLPSHKLAKPELCAIKQWLYQEVDGNADFKRIMTIFGVKRPVSDEHRISIPAVLELHCETDLASDATNIEAGMQNIASSPWHSILTDLSGNDVALNFYLHDTAKDPRFGSFDMNLVGQIMKSFDEHITARYPHVHPHWTGMAAYQYFLKQGFDQTGVLNLFMAVLVFALFWLFFASIRTGVLFIITIVISSIIIYGAMAIAGCPIDVLTNILTLMLVLSSLEDFLFIVHENQKPNSHWRRSFRKLLMPGFFTSVTTAIGFGSLAATDLGIIRRFGAFASMAALLEWGIVFLFLPACMVRFPRFRLWLTPPAGKRTRLISKLGKIGSFRISKGVAIASLSVYLFSAYGLSRLHVTDAPTHIFPHDHVASQDLRYIEGSRNWQSEVSLVFKDYGSDAENRKILDQYEKLDNVSWVENPYRIEDYLTNSLAHSDQRTVKQAWQDSEAGGRLLAQDGSARAIVYLKKTDTASIDALSAATEKLCPSGECEIAGSLVSYAEFGDRVLATLLESLGMSLGLVSLVLIYLLAAKGQKEYFSTIAAAMWGPFTLICIFWAFHLPVTYVTSTFASILVGIAGDNTIQYLFGDKRGSVHHGVESQAGASVQVTLMMMVLSCVLFGAYFAPLRTLGALFMVGFALTLLGDLWVFKGLIFS